MGLDEFLHEKDVVKELRRSAAAGHRFLEIAFDRLLEFDRALAEELLDRPKEFLPKADELLTELTKIPGFRLRVRGLERTLQGRDVRAEHVGKFIQVYGDVECTIGPALVPSGDGYRDYLHIRIDGLDIELDGDLVSTLYDDLLQGKAKAIITGRLAAVPSSERSHEGGPLFQPSLVANCVTLEKKGAA